MLSFFLYLLYWKGEKCNFPFVLGTLAMHCVGSAGNTFNSTRPRKEKRLTYALNNVDDTKVGQGFCHPSN